MVIEPLASTLQTASMDCVVKDKLGGSETASLKVKLNPLANQVTR